MRKTQSLILVVCMLVMVLTSGLFAQAWWGTIGKQFPAQTGSFTIEFDLVPRDVSVARAHITLSNMSPATWGDNACIIRCVVPDEGDGYLDARNGGTYEAVEVYNYYEDESYHVKIEVDVAAETYSVTANVVGGDDMTPIATDYAFRTDQAGVGQLQYVNITIPYESIDEGIDDPGAELKNIVVKDADDNEVWQDPGTDVNAFRVAIDAERDAFFDGLTGPDDGYIFLPSVATGTGEMPDDDIDCSGLVWFAWDEMYLYCYAEITDDVINVNNATTYDNDCLELKIDPDPLAETTTGVAAVRLTAYGEDWAEEPAGVDNLIAGGELDEVFEPVEGVDYARKEVETDDRYGYNLEFRLPFEVIVREEKYVDNAVGGIMGMAVNLHDNDEGAREAALRWAASMDDQVWANPQLHGTVTFLEGNKLKLEAINSAGGDAVNENPEWYIPPATLIEEPEFTPIDFALQQNYPNPFNPTTSIVYSVESMDRVTLTVYNLAGQQVMTLVDKVQTAGHYTVTFDASQLSSGVYLYQLQNGTKVMTKKMTLLK